MRLPRLPFRLRGCFLRLLTWNGAPRSRKVLKFRIDAQHQEIGVKPAILRSCLTLSGDKISSASISIHQPQRSITRHAEEFGTVIIENRRIAGLTPVSVSRPEYSEDSRSEGRIALNLNPRGISPPLSNY